jgi:hypothetical protein
MSYDAPGGPPGGAMPPPPGGYGNPPSGGYGVPPSGGYGVPPGYGGYGQAPYGKPPSTFRAWAITCIVCGVLFSLIIGLPCALVALSYSRRVPRAWQAGDMQGAAKASKRARIWVIVSIVFDVLGFILVIALVSYGGSSTT